MKTYVIWNSDKLSQAIDSYNDGKAPKDQLHGDTSKYTTLEAYETADNASVSSEIQTSDIISVVDGVYNETDIELCFELVRG